MATAKKGKGKKAAPARKAAARTKKVKKAPARKAKPAAKAKPARAKAKPARAKAKPAKAKMVRKPKPRKAPAARPAAPPPDAGIRALAQRIIDLTMSNDDEATLGLYAPDVESVEMGQPPLQGVDALRGKFAGWRNMVSDSHFEPRRVCVDGNTIVIEWVGHMTMAATGQRAEMHEVAIHEIRDGKIAREAYFYNPGALASSE